MSSIVKEVLTVVNSINEGKKRFELYMVRGNKEMYIKGCKDENEAKKLADDLDFDSSWRAKIKMVDTEKGKIVDSQILHLD